MRQCVPPTSAGAHLLRVWWWLAGSGVWAARHSRPSRHRELHELVRQRGCILQDAVRQAGVPEEASNAPAVAPTVPTTFTAYVARCNMVCRWIWLCLTRGMQLLRVQTQGNARPRRSPSRKLPTKVFLPWTIPTTRMAVTSTTSRTSRMVARPTVGRTAMRKTPYLGSRKKL